jgi:hypothetical protein
MSIVTFILGLFGVDLSKKTVTFADEVESSKEETPTESTPVPVESSSSESTQ